MQTFRSPWDALFLVFVDYVVVMVIVEIVLIQIFTCNKLYDPWVI